MKTILTISDSYYQTRVNTFFQSSYQTSLALWGNYSQSILHTFQDIKLYWHFQRVTAKQYCTLFQSLHQKILTFSESSFPIKLHLIYVTLWTRVRSGLLISMLGKLSWFLLTGLITMVLLMWKWMGLFLRKNHLLRCWGWPSLLNWIGALTLSLLLKLPPTKLGA